MAIDPLKYYSTLTDAIAYNNERPHSIWSTVTTSNQEKFMLDATRAIDRLAFKGKKKAVYDLLVADPDATEAEIRAADDGQILQFPRDTQTVVPERIFFAHVNIFFFEFIFSLLN